MRKRKIMDDLGYSNRCFNYGIGHGCDAQCPALRDGECNMEDPIAMADQLSEECDSETIQNICSYYPTLLREFRKRKIKQLETTNQ